MALFIWPFTNLSAAFLAVIKFLSAQGRRVMMARIKSVCKKFCGTVDSAVVVPDSTGPEFESSHQSWTIIYC